MFDLRTAAEFDLRSAVVFDLRTAAEFDLRTAAVFAAAAVIGALAASWSCVSGELELC